MAIAEIFTARKTYHCQHCKGKIIPGQDYYKKRERGNRYGTAAYFIEWHADKSQCQPHTHKDNCTADCKVEEVK